MKKNDDIEDLFKKSFENYEPEVNSRVWKNIQTGLKGVGLGIFGKILLNKIGTKTVIAILSSAAVVGGAVAIITWMNGSSNKQNLQINNTITSKKVAEKSQSINIPEIKTGEKIAAAEKFNVEHKPVTIPNVKSIAAKSNTEASNVSLESIAVISASSLNGKAPLIVSLSNTGTGKTNKWTCTDGKDTKAEENPVHIFEEPGIYTVMLMSKNADGKTDLDSIKVEVTGDKSLPLSSIPADYTISPNGDDKNDYFKIQLQNVASLDGKICDGDGNVIQAWNSWKGNLLIWDGKDSKGNDVQEGKYYYVFNSVSLNGKKRVTQGSIKLIR